MQQLPTFIARHLAGRRKLLVVFIIVVTLFMAGSALRVRPDYSGVAFDVHQSESAREYQEFISTFGGDAYILLAFARSGRISDSLLKAQLSAAGREIDSMDGILRVMELSRIPVSGGAHEWSPESIAYMRRFIPGMSQL
ncbi:MAG: hypothetical protein MI802_15185, partial [Desulfobacterales bacterium]|nr:hypothetical protein [Desulfobacterales bacterium]